MADEAEVVWSRDSVVRFYEQAVRRGVGTTEHLDAPVREEFLEELQTLDPAASPNALDLGYGFGAYTLALRRAGLAVVAVDQVPPGPLVQRMAAAPGPPAEILRSRLEDYRPDRPFGFVLARDVLHYLERTDVSSLLGRLTTSAPVDALHYLEVFTDIQRTDAEGRRVRIEGEALFSTRGLVDMLGAAYTGWRLRIKRHDHAERDQRAESARDYFVASRVIVIARHG